MKYLVLIGDGMSDHPLPELKGKTPLEAARTPNLDLLARQGCCGWVKNVPAGMPPASDVANLSIFGYDPKKYYTGRGPLEAASLGIKLAGDEVAFRCNLVSVERGRMKDFTAGHISTKEAAGLMKLLDRQLGGKLVKFFPGLSYRHLLVVSSAVVGSTVKTTPPHDITGRSIRPYLPKGRGADQLIRLMNESEVLLHERRTRATIIWPWSPGKTPAIPSFRSAHGKKAAIITAVHLLKGIGRIAGMQVIDVPGATGYLDTNYRGKARYALNALKHNDLVFIHVEAPDEAGHEGSIPKKIKAIEDFDRLVVGTILTKIRKSKSEIRMMVLPDHPTPVSMMTHTAEAVPFVVWGAGVREGKCSAPAYNERAIKRSRLRLARGHRLLGKLLKDKWTIKT